MRAMVDVGAVLGRRSGRGFMMTPGRRQASVSHGRRDGIVVVRIGQERLDRRQHREQRNERDSPTEDAKQERSTTDHRETTRPLETKNSCGYRTCDPDPGHPVAIRTRLRRRWRLPTPGPKGKRMEVTPASCGLVFQRAG